MTPVEYVQRQSEAQAGEVEGSEAQAGTIDARSGNSFPVSDIKMNPTAEKHVSVGADLSGLSESEAELRLRTDGPNALAKDEPRGWFAIVLEVLREPMFLMLLAAGSLYLMMGETRDALMLLFFVLVIMAITIFQERRTERAIEALRELSGPQALVIREGEARRIAGTEVVRGDLVVLSEGDRVPADGVMRRSEHLVVDESLLTGESVPVRKQASATRKDLEKPGGDDLSSVFSGTLVTGGQGIAEVVAVGTRSALGNIGDVLRQVKPEATQLQKETRRLVRIFAIAGAVACALVVVTYALTRGGGAHEWKQGLLGGIALAMAILPEEFPVVLTVFLAFGAYRISKSQVLTRRTAAIETLGAANVLCVDKTGTLTENRMTVRKVVTGGVVTSLGEGDALSEEAQIVLESAFFASRREPFDPMEKAIQLAALPALAPTGKLEWPLYREYPLTRELLAVTQVYQTTVSDELFIATKGAPEAILELCGVAGAKRQELIHATEELAERGLRVLGVARGRTRPDALGESQRDLPLEFLGLLALEDPLREGVRDAVQECAAAGLRVVMITGDYPKTARTVAERAGIGPIERIMTGAELERMSDEAFVREVRSVRVFARVVPEQKLRIVNALKAAGEIVAMTGDGVNDAPALKSAHIGIAMGQRGTDVAREAASLVLLTDDFASIAHAIRLGRRIYDNIKKAIAFILAVHVPIIGLSMLPVFIPSWPLLLFPAHIVFLELIIDPTCSLVFEAEPEEGDVMRRPPRRRDEHLFGWDTVAISVLQGVGVLAASLLVLWLALERYPVDAARGLSFATLVLGSLALIFINRSWTSSAWSSLKARNPALRWVMIASLTLLGIVLLVPAARSLFHFAPFAFGDFLAATLAAFLSVGWFELVKAVRRGRAHSRAG